VHAANKIQEYPQFFASFDVIIVNACVVNLSNNVEFARLLVDYCDNGGSLILSIFANFDGSMQSIEMSVFKNHSPLVYRKSQAWRKHPAFKVAQRDSSSSTSSASDVYPARTNKLHHPILRGIVNKQLPSLALVECPSDINGIATNGTGILYADSFDAIVIAEKTPQPNSGVVVSLNFYNVSKAMSEYGYDDSEQTIGKADAYVVRRLLYNTVQYAASRSMARNKYNMRKKLFSLQKGGKYTNVDIYCNNDQL